MSIQDNMANEPKSERKQISFEEFMRSVLSEIDPAKYAGESFFAVEEYARPDDIKDPWVRADIRRFGQYYPRPETNEF